MTGSKRTEKTENETAPVGAETVSKIPNPFKSKELVMNIIPSPSSDDEVVDWCQDFTLSSSERPIGWFEVPRDLTRRINRSQFPEGATQYGLKALEAESRRVLVAGEGARNTTLWSTGCKIGQLVGGGEIDLAFAISSLRRAALSAGLEEEEIQQVLLRRAGALETGISTPRNRFGSLAEQFRSKLLARSSFNENLFVLGTFTFWHEALNAEAPGFQCLALQWQIQQLGVIYWANYLYFLNEIHLLALSGAKGTSHIYELLKSQFLTQASEWEKLFVEIDFGLSSIIANTPPFLAGPSLEVHDSRLLVEDVS